MSEALSRWSALGAFSGGLVGGLLGSGYADSAHFASNAADSSQTSFLRRLLGVVTVQTVRYYEVFGSKDRATNKVAVSACWFLSSQPRRRSDMAPPRSHSSGMIVLLL